MVNSPKTAEFSAKFLQTVEIQETTENVPEYRYDVAFSGDVAVNDNVRILIPSLKDITQALEKAAVQCTYAEGQMLMVTNGAEKEHCAFIRKGLWTYKSFRQGQSPNLAAIQKAPNSAVDPQQEESTL